MDDLGAVGATGKCDTRIDVPAPAELEERLIRLAGIYGKPRAQLAREFLTIQIEGAWMLMHEGPSPDSRQKLMALSVILGKPVEQLSEELLSIQVEGAFRIMQSSLSLTSIARDGNSVGKNGGVA